MSSVRTVALSGFLALLLAVSMIAVVFLSGAPVIVGAPNSTSTGTTSVTNPTSISTGTNPTTNPTSTLTGTNPITTPTGGSQTTSTTSASSSVVAGSGFLSILLTDPPRVPAGVSKVYVSYSGLAVHGDQGWIIMKAAGQVEFLGTVNLGQTLSSAKVVAGSYDMLRFDISSATITYNGRNYTATVQGGQLTIRVEGEEQVSNTQGGALIIDVQPTVVNLGSRSSPQFFMRAVARAFPVPNSEVNSNMEQEGNRMSLVGRSWWSDDQAAFNAGLQITGASLSANFLTVDAKNTGTTGLQLRLIVVIPENASAGVGSMAIMPEQAYGSAIFVVLPNGTLVDFRPLLGIVNPMIRGENQSSIFQWLQSSGYNLTAGSTTTLSYSGTITLGFGMMAQGQGISPGTSYQITLIGDQALASVVIQAT